MICLCIHVHKGNKQNKNVSRYTHQRERETHTHTHRGGDCGVLLKRWSCLFTWFSQCMDPPPFALISPRVHTFVCGSQWNAFDVLITSFVSSCQNALGKLAQIRILEMYTMNTVHSVVNTIYFTISDS